jgi:hypothetical protein
MSPRPLTPGSLRAHLYALTHASALLGHGPVTFTREQLASHFPRGAEQHPSLPASYDAESYLLTGDDTLEPAS